MRVTPTSGYKVPVATKNKLTFGSDERAEHHRLSHIMDNFRPGMGISPPAPVQSTPTSIPQPNTTTADHFSTTVAASEPEPFGDAIQALMDMRRASTQQMEIDKAASPAPPLIKWNPINGRSGEKNPFQVGATSSLTGVPGPIVSSPTVMSRRETMNEPAASTSVPKPRGRRKTTGTGKAVRPASQVVESGGGFKAVNASSVASLEEEQTTKPSKKVAAKRAEKSTTAKPPVPNAAKKTKRTGAAKHTSGVNATAPQEAPRLPKAASPIKQVAGADSDEDDFQPIAPSRRGTNNRKVIYTSSTDEEELDDNTPMPVHQPFATLEGQAQKDLYSLLKAAEKGDLSQIKKLLKKNRNLLNQGDEYGFTPLMAAASENQAHVVQFLLDRKGIQPNLQDHQQKYTAAMYPNPDKKNYFETLTVMLDYAKAHPGKIDFTTLKDDKNHKTALDYANDHATEKFNLDRKKRGRSEAIRERMLLDGHSLG